MGRFLWILCMVPIFLVANVLYDERGNLVQHGDVHYSYDMKNQLVEVVNGDHHIVYQYDATGRRESRTLDGEIEYFVHMGKHEFAVLDESGKIKELRVAGLTPHKDLFLAKALQVGDRYYEAFHDERYNLVKLVDLDSDEVIEISFNDPFGGDLPKDAPSRWIFSGKPYDSEADLVYFGARYYSPKLRQWLTPDPAGQYDNPYTYCNNDPLTYFDPDGEFAIPVLGVAWGAGLTISAPVLGGVTAAATGIYLGYEGYKYLAAKLEEKREQEQQIDPSGATRVKEKPSKKTKKEKKLSPPKWEDLGDDPTKCPGKGYVWKGRGPKGSKKGNWTRGDKDLGTKEDLHPDLDHGQPIGPHWDYWGPGFEDGIRIKPDGTWEPKEK